jgi:uncharacterized repeat protein (TIGR01451 family)
MAVAVLGGAAVAGQAATPQQVKATLSCEPSTVKPGTSTGCVLTVTNVGGNNVNNVTITDTASAGASFLSSSRPTLCAISDDKLVLTCNIGKLTAAGTLGATFSETHELQVPSTGAVSQGLQGRYSSTSGNNRGSDSIAVPDPLSTSLDGSPDFDGRFANEAADFVQTDAISAGNPYSTRATLGTTGFAVGLTVKERAAESSPNCPSTGCFGGQVIDFAITPLAGTEYPNSFTLTIKVYVGPGIKDTDLDVRHTTLVNNVLTTSLVPLCSTDPDHPPYPSGDCISSRAVNSSTKVATIVIEGPGTGNGGWGVG